MKHIIKKTIFLLFLLSYNSIYPALVIDLNSLSTSLKKLTVIFIEKTFETLKTSIGTSDLKTYFHTTYSRPNKISDLNTIITNYTTYKLNGGTHDYQAISDAADLQKKALDILFSINEKIKSILTKLLPSLTDPDQKTLVTNFLSELKKPDKIFADLNKEIYGIIFIADKIDQDSLEALMGQYKAFTGCDPVKRSAVCTIIDQAVINLENALLVQPFTLIADVKPDLDAFKKAINDATNAEQTIATNSSTTETDDYLKLLKDLNNNNSLVQGQKAADKIALVKVSELSSENKVAYNNLKAELITAKDTGKDLVARIVQKLSNDVITAKNNQKNMESACSTKGYFQKFGVQIGTITIGEFLNKIKPKIDSDTTLSADEKWQASTCIQLAAVANSAAINTRNATDIQTSLNKVFMQIEGALISR